MSELIIDFDVSTQMQEAAEFLKRVMLLVDVPNINFKIVHGGVKISDLENNDPKNALKINFTINNAFSLNEQLTLQMSTAKTRAYNISCYSGSMISHAKKRISGCPSYGYDLETTDPKPLAEYLNEQLSLLISRAASDEQERMIEANVKLKKEMVVLQEQIDRHNKRYELMKELEI